MGCATSAPAGVLPATNDSPSGTPQKSFLRRQSTRGTPNISNRSSAHNGNATNFGHGTAPEIVYVIGGSGCGKSTYVLEHFSFHAVIDPDKLSGLCPEQDDNPDAKNSVTYRWSKKRCVELLEEALTRRAGQYAVPGTGKTTARQGADSYMAKLLVRAREAGFVTRLIYLKCSTETAKARNASRKRTLPDEVVIKSLADAEAAYELLKPTVHEARVVDVSMDVSFKRGRSMTGAAFTKALEQMPVTAAPFEGRGGGRARLIYFEEQWEKRKYRRC